MTAILCRRAIGHLDPAAASQRPTPPPRTASAAEEPSGEPASAEEVVGLLDEPATKAEIDQNTNMALLGDWVAWKGYTTEELRRIVFIHRCDPVGFFLAACVVASFCRFFLAAEDDSFFTAGLAARHAVLAVGHNWYACGCAVLGAIPLLMHMYALPVSERKGEENMWQAMSVVGRWAYLTRWALAFQAAYMGLCWFAENAHHSTWALRAGYGTAVFAAALNVFVTVQYYTLVYPTKSSQSICAKWNARGVDYGTVQGIIHAVGGPLALFDLWLVKDRALLKALLPPLATLATGMAAFASLYIAAISLNRRATGAWPYSMMDGLTTVPKFAVFVVGQIGALTVFVGLVWTPLVYFG